jgi:hypothetical protein
MKRCIIKEGITMKQKFYFLVVLGPLIAICLPLTDMAVAQEGHGLKLATAAICRNVVDREPVDAGTSFEPSVGKLSCFTHVMGAQGAIEIYHVWYFAESERAVVKLQVKSASWRTYSSKIIQPHEIGKWHVDVLGPEGDVLKVLHFEITP